MRGCHIPVHPGSHRLGGNTDGATDTNDGQFAPFEHAAYRPGGHIAKLAGRFVEIPEQGLRHLQALEKDSGQPRQLQTPPRHCGSSRYQAWIGSAYWEGNRS